MANIKKIKAGSSTYDIDATYWGTNSVDDAKLINGRSIFSEIEDGDPYVEIENELLNATLCDDFDSATTPFTYGFVNLGQTQKECIVHTMIYDWDYNYRRQIAYSMDNTLIFTRLYNENVDGDWSNWEIVPTASSLKTINGQSLTGSGNIFIQSPQPISSDAISLMLSVFDNIGSGSSGNGISEALVEETEGE